MKFLADLFSSKITYLNMLHFYLSIFNIAHILLLYFQYLGEIHYSKNLALVKIVQA